MVIVQSLLTFLTYLGTKPIINAAGDVQQVTVWAAQAVLGRASVARTAALVTLLAVWRPARSPKGPLGPTLQVVPRNASPGRRVLLPVGPALHAPAAVVRVAPGAPLRAGDALPYPAVGVEPLGALPDAGPLVEKGTLVKMEEVEIGLNIKNLLESLLLLYCCSHLHFSPNALVLCFEL